jgi:hypothetical protein
MGVTFIQKSAGKGSLRGHLARQDAPGKSGIVVPAAATETVRSPIIPAGSPLSGDLLSRLWKEADFKPNDSQRQAILHTEGPLLPAGRTGKTRVLLWFAINLIANHQVTPQDIYLSTFTEKAALQLRDGLRAMLSTIDPPPITCHHA